MLKYTKEKATDYKAKDHPPFQRGTDIIFSDIVVAKILFCSPILFFSIPVYSYFILDA